MDKTCRFCYSYKPPTVFEPYCPTVISATNNTLSSMSSTTSVINNNIQSSGQTHLQFQEQNLLRAVQSTTIKNTIQSTIDNSAAINSTLMSQLATLRDQRYTPYQPYVPPVIPCDVIEFQRMTANVGNPMPPTFRCKGTQFVTK